MSNNSRFMRDASMAKVYVVDPATDTIEYGDLLQWDTVTRTAKRLAAAANAAAFIGVAEGAVPPSSNIDNSTTLVTRMTVRQRGTFKLKTTAVETYSHGDAVTLGADNQTIAATSDASQVIGYIDLPDGTQVTGAAGVEVPVVIRPNFPSDTLD